MAAKTKKVETEVKVEEVINEEVETEVTDEIATDDVEVVVEKSKGKIAKMVDYIKDHKKQFGIGLLAVTTVAVGYKLLSGGSTEYVVTDLVDDTLDEVKDELVDVVVETF